MQGSTKWEVRTVVRTEKEGKTRTNWLFVHKSNQRIVKIGELRRSASSNWIHLDISLSLTRLLLRGRSENRIHHCKSQYNFNALYICTVSVLSCKLKANKLFNISFVHLRHKLLRLFFEFDKSTFRQTVLRPKNLEDKSPGFLFSPLSWWPYFEASS